MWAHIFLACVADVILPQLVTSAKQRRYPCYGPPMDSIYQNAFRIFLQPDWLFLTGQSWPVFKSWYTGGGPEHDFGYERPSIDDQDHYRHFDRGFRSVVENEDLYGRNYRLINENHDRYYPKGVTKNTVALVKRKVGDEHSRSKELKRRSVDWWQSRRTGTGWRPTASVIQDKKGFFYVHETVFHEADKALKDECNPLDYTSIDNLDHKDLHSQPPIENLNHTDRDHQSSTRITIDGYDLPYSALFRLNQSLTRA